MPPYIRSVGTLIVKGGDGNGSLAEDLVMVDHVSNWVWLGPAEASTTPFDRAASTTSAQDHRGSGGVVLAGGGAGQQGSWTRGAERGGGGESPPLLTIATEVGTRRHLRRDLRHRRRDVAQALSFKTAATEAVSLSAFLASLGSSASPSSPSLGPCGSRPWCTTGSTFSRSCSKLRRRRPVPPPPSFAMRMFKALKMVTLDQAIGALLFHVPVHVGDGADDGQRCPGGWVPGRRQFEKQPVGHAAGVLEDMAGGEHDQLRLRPGQAASALHELRWAGVEHLLVRRGQLERKFLLRRTKCEIIAVLHVEAAAAAASQHQSRCR